MNMKTNEEHKCVIVVDATLPIGLIANTSAILGVTLGREVEDIIGPVVMDGAGNPHVGVVTVPIPILKAEKEQIRELKEKTLSEEFADLLTVDFTNVAQTSPAYEVYTERMAQHATGDLEYLGIALFGGKKKINKLTGSLPLLR